MSKEDFPEKECLSWELKNEELFLRQKDWEVVLQEEEAEYDKTVNWKGAWGIWRRKKGGSVAGSWSREEWEEKTAMRWGFHDGKKPGSVELVKDSGMHPKTLKN